MIHKRVARPASDHAAEHLADERPDRGTPERTDRDEPAAVAEQPGGEPRAEECTDDEARQREQACDEPAPEPRDRGERDHGDRDPVDDVHSPRYAVSSRLPTSGTRGDHPARSTSTSDGGVTTTAS